MKRPYMPKRSYVVTVSRGRRTRYFYGETLKSAMDVAGIAKGDEFHYALFSRQFIRIAQVTAGKKGNVTRYAVPRDQ